MAAPPYDVISPEDQGFYYALNSYNIIRIILGKDLAGDNDKENKYTRAARFYREWLKAGILQKEKDPALYVYRQKYVIGQQNKQRSGFVALMKLEDFGRGVVFPHEETFPKPQNDRLSLLRNCWANFNPIFGLYSDSSLSVDACLEENENLAGFEDREGVVHELGKIGDREKIRDICAMMTDKKVFIADGHHRYKTALAFRKEGKERFSSSRSPRDFVLMYFLNMDTDGAAILPVHRILGNLKAQEVTIVRSRIKDFFSVQVLGRGNRRNEVLEILGRNEEIPRFGMYEADGRYSVLTLKRRASEWETDSALLHEILKEILPGKILNKRKEMDFVEKSSKATRLVEEGRYQVAFLLRPVPLKKLRSISLAGKMMPPKTTYFYPKLFSGLIARDLKDGVW